MATEIQQNVFAALSLQAQCFREKFLGWKVQFIRELSNSEKVEHPFWEINQEEEIILENELYQSGLFSTDDLLKSNTPPKERKRRADFQRKIDNLFD